MSIPTVEEIDLLHSNICQALGDPKRIQILYALHNRPCHVSALADELNTPQPTISRHLRVLRQRSMVQTERNGTSITYRLSDPTIIEILNNMRQILRSTLEQQTSIFT